MRKQARRTDTAIIIVLIIIAISIFFSVQKKYRQSDAPPDPLPLESYNGKTLGALPGSQFEAVTAECFPDSPIAYYTGNPELYAALITEKIDGFVMSEVTLIQMQREHLNVTWLPDILNTRYRYFGFAKTAKGEKLCTQMDEMLAEFKADGTMTELENIWYGEDDTRKIVVDSDLTGENGTLKVGVSASDEPYNYVRNNQITGFNIDILTRFARRFGYAIEYTDTEPSSLLIGLTTGRFDMLATTISYTEERAQTILFSDPALQFDTVLAVRQEAAAVQQQPGLLESLAGSFKKTFIREERWKLIVKGIGTTCLITITAAILGTLLAFAICLFRRTGSTLANMISDIYVKLMQGIPIVVLLLILYYVIFGQSVLTAVWIAAIGFSLHFGAYTSEALRSGINSVNPGQREAALALGFSERQAFFQFIFPQAVNHILPVYNGEIISLLKGTAIAGYISVQDLTKMSDIIRSRTYEAFFPLIATALIYFLLAWIIRLLLDVAMNWIDPRKKGGKNK